jgi:hypothetical protein
MDRDLLNSNMDSNYQDSTDLSEVDDFFSSQGSEYASQQLSSGEISATPPPSQFIPVDPAVLLPLIPIPQLGTKKHDLTSYIWDFGTLFAKVNDGDYWRCNLCKCVS